MIFPQRGDNTLPSVSFQQFRYQALGVHSDPGTKEMLGEGPDPQLPKPCDHSHYWRSLTHEDTQWGHKEPSWPSGSGKLLKMERNHRQGCSSCTEASQRSCHHGNSPVHCKASGTQCRSCMGELGSLDQDLADVFCCCVLLIPAFALYFLENIATGNVYSCPQISDRHIPRKGPLATPGTMRL